MIALYSRVSTQEQALEGYSIGEQQERLKSFALSFGWKDFKLYTDPGFSGASMDRPALQELIRDAESGKIARVVVYKLDRLSRSQKDTLYLIEDVFLAHGCEFISMSESFSTETPVGRATIGLLAVFAQLERETIKERMMVGRTARAKAGLYHGGGQSPGGYDFIDGRLYVNESEAFQIREIFQLYASGLTIRQVRDDLNDRGLLFRGSLWTWEHVKTVLHNPLYAGKVSFSGELYDGEHEALVDMETFERVTALLDKRRNNYTEARVSAYSNDWLLLGFSYCKKCGSRLTSSASSKAGRRYDYYACTCRRDKGFSRSRGIVCDAKPIRKEKLEKEVLDQIRLLAMDPEYIKSRKEEVKTKKEPDEIPVLRAQISRLDSQISRMLDLYADGEFSVDVLTQKTQMLREARQNAQERLFSLESRKSSSNKENALKAILSFSDAVERLDIPQMKIVVSSLISRIEYADDELSIFWNFD